MRASLRVGIQLPEVERDVRWPEYVAIARAAEEPTRLSPARARALLTRTLTLLMP